MRILNLFAGLGGNRKLWKGEITAVELNEDIYEIYRATYPKDRIICQDAYAYCVQHIDDGWDFIWASPPCQSHTRLNITGQNLRLPDLRLYELIIFLQTFAKCRWVVENVIPYYKPLIKPTQTLGRHHFWSNFTIYPKRFTLPKNWKDLPLEQLQQLTGLKGTRQQLRNCVTPALGLYIFQQFQHKSLLEGGA